MIVSFDFVTALKKAVQEECGVYVHFHDGCGGQYFTLEQPDDGVRAFLSVYLQKQNLSAVFSEDAKRFTLQALTK